MTCLQAPCPSDSVEFAAPGPPLAATEGSACTHMLAAMAALTMSSSLMPCGTKAANAGVSQAFVAPSGAGETAGTDAAANPTRAVPGELTYHFGGLAAPTTDEYKAKDSAE